MNDAWKPATLTAGVVANLVATVLWQAGAFATHEVSQQSPSPSGCAPYGVYAQNRWQPVGTRKLDQPTALGNKIGGFAPNEIISVDGWVHGTPINAHNQPPFDSDIWLRLSDRTGWVAWAATRGVPTTPDPTNLADGGTPAPAPAACAVPQP